MKRFIAWLLGYFWLPCPICGKMFAGFEIGMQAYKGKIVCKDIRCNVSAAVREYAEGRGVPVLAVFEECCGKKPETPAGGEKGNGQNKKD